MELLVSPPLSHAVHSALSRQSQRDLYCTPERSNVFDRPDAFVRHKGNFLQPLSLPGMGAKPPSSGTIAEEVPTESEACRSPMSDGRLQRNINSGLESLNADILHQLGPETDHATYASLLTRCTTAKALSEGKRVHEHMNRRGYAGNRFLGNLLVQMYSKCGSLDSALSVFEKILYRDSYSWNIMIAACTRNGSLDDARALFAEMPQRSVVSWNSMIAACAQNGHGNEALRLFGQMQAEGFQPNKITFICLIDVCTSVEALEDGRLIHAILASNGGEGDVVVGTSLVNMYGKCRSIDDAGAAFAQIPRRDAVSWTAMITACTQNGRGKEALQWFGQMQAEGFDLDKITFMCVVHACANVASLEESRAIHTAVVGNGWEWDVIVGNALVNMYSKCGSLEDARIQFAEMPQRNVVSWSTMISACAQNGHGKEALQLFIQMQGEDYEPSEVTIVCIVDASAMMALLEEGLEIHATVAGGGWESDVGVGTALIHMYGKCGSLDDAVAVFVMMTQHDVVSWSAMIAACSQNGHGKGALQWFDQMKAEGFEPDKIAFICILDACAAIEEVRLIHATISGNGWVSDVVVGSALVKMYGKYGSLDDARAVFAQMAQQSVASWGAMISACAQNGQGQEALQLFGQLQAKGLKLDKIMFICILDACTSVAALEEGQDIHATIVGKGWESDVVVGTALANMYGKCRSLDDARVMFAEMPQRDVVSCSAMIEVCAESGHAKEALELLGQAQAEGFKTNKITFLCAVDACATLAAFEEGRVMHATIVGNGWDSDVVVGTALVNMYGKCGNVDDARAAFTDMPERNVVSWNAMMSGYAQNGHCKEALRLFDQMQVEGSKPNTMTFMWVLTACSHAGLLTDGRRYFASMKRDHGISPSVEHYVRMIDLLGRRGLLEEAEELIISMPFEHVPSAWLSLLSSCRIHNDMERAVRATNLVLELDPRSASSYVLLANMHGNVSRLDDAVEGIPITV